MGRRYTIRHVRDSGRVDAVLEFYDAHEDAHVWPRSRAELESMANDWLLYEAVDSRGAVVATCYMRSDDEPADSPHAGRLRWEIGGLYAVEGVRKSGLAEVLVRVCIIGLYVHQDPQGERLVGHVHEFNNKPRKLLERLGFVHRGQEIPPAHVAPPNLTRNGDGHVVGHLFVFPPESLDGFAEWLSKHRGRLDGGDEVDLDVAFCKQDRERAVLALREIAAEATQQCATSTTPQQ